MYCVLCTVYCVQSEVYSVHCKTLVVYFIVKCLQLSVSIAQWWVHWVHQPCPLPCTAVFCRGGNYCPVITGRNLGATHCSSVQFCSVQYSAVHCVAWQSPKDSSKLLVSGAHLSACLQSQVGATKASNWPWLLPAGPEFSFILPSYPLFYLLTTFCTKVSDSFCTLLGDRSMSRIY